MLIGVRFTRLLLGLPNFAGTDVDRNSETSPPKFCGTNNWFWGKPPGVSSKSLENQASLQKKTAELLIYFTLRFCDINESDRKIDITQDDRCWWVSLFAPSKKGVCPERKTSGAARKAFFRNIPTEAWDPFNSPVAFFRNHSTTEHPQTQKQETDRFAEVTWGDHFPLPCAIILVLFLKRVN